MSSDTKIVKLSEVAYFQEGPGILAKDFHAKGVPLLRLKSIEGAYASLKGCNFLDPEKVERKWNHFKTKKGDLLISTSASLGRVSIVTAESEGAIPYTGIIKFSSKSELLLDSYLRAFLSSSEFIRQAESMASGSVISHFGPTHIKEMTIKLPSIEKQQYIGNLHTKLDEKIRVLHHQNTALESIAQTLFRSWFVNFDPVHAKATGNAPEAMSAELAELFPSEFEGSKIGLIPKGWRIEKLGTVCNYLSRGLSPKYIEDSSKGVSVLNQKCIRDFCVDYKKGRRHDPAQRKIDGRELVVGDVLVNSTGVGTLGRVAQVLQLSETTVVDSHVTVVRGGPELNWPYLGQLMTYKQPDIEEMGEGSTGQTELSRNKLSAVLVLVPPLDNLHLFKKIVLPILMQKANNGKIMQSLASLRDHLLPRLISGKLSIGEAEKAVAELLPEPVEAI